ncbi:uncharacterized protein K489DRAFT_176086 [Dissoconium aciculare CBS 342.82]|uniref:Uncharacterized protein n=1 Tax=Dissoconium aciculare CBS 342.82 TaxID=1314786 RepID=A0A6J3M7Z2_9PEZI|nr:uncharacterized protein K489DRAFT_176086 [Dissoconium aciculare CBS 342.82]KAF1824176.1 hypothetical protein K489DRAFT_176086 [Dissoconium aciculare CBS 342.82]
MSESSLHIDRAGQRYSMVISQVVSYSVSWQALRSSSYLPCRFAHYSCKPNDLARYTCISRCTLEPRAVVLYSFSALSLAFASTK